MRRGKFGLRNRPVIFGISNKVATDLSSSPRRYALGSTQPETLTDRGYPNLFFFGNEPRAIVGADKGQRALHDGAVCQPA